MRADLDNMKGSTVDAMSAAIDNAAVMVFCISLAYKESSSEHTTLSPDTHPPLSDFVWCRRCLQTVGSKLSIATSKKSRWCP